jgi:hypothetical protein
MPRLSADDKKIARELILENMDRFIKRYYDDDRTLIIKDCRKPYGVVERNIYGHIETLLIISRNSFTDEPYYEDFRVKIVSNVNGMNIVCDLYLKWNNRIIGKKIVSCYKNFKIKNQTTCSKKMTSKTISDFYENYIRLYPDIELVDFDFQW